MARLKAKSKPKKEYSVDSVKDGETNVKTPYKTLLWIGAVVIGWYFAFRVGFGAVYAGLAFLLWILVWGLDWDKKSSQGLSAYAMLNPGAARLTGDFGAEQYDREIRSAGRGRAVTSSSIGNKPTPGPTYVVKKKKKKTSRMKLKL